MKDLQQTAFGRKSGRMYTPAEVPSGLACACECAGCGAALVAKKGEFNRWHFSHHAVETGPSCAESAIHAAAKQVLLDHNWLYLPMKRITVSGVTMSGTVLEESRLLSAERIVRFDRSQAEVSIDDIRPDIVGYRDERQLLVEMYFRHQVDENKLNKLAQIKLPTIEIDLSDLDAETGFDAVAARVLYSTTHKAWLYFPREDVERQRLQSILTDRIHRANQAHVARKGVELQRKAVRERRQEQEQARKDLADAYYRKKPAHDKEQELRARLGIRGGWPYYLRKQSTAQSVIADPAMIWQGALFSRFVFHRENREYELKQDDVLKWVRARFDTDTSTPMLVDAEVRRYLGYLSACGFLKKLPHTPYDAQGYVVIHGELAPPKRNGRSSAATQKPRDIDAAEPPKSEPARPIWIWRANWPKRASLLEAAANLAAGSSHANQFTRLLNDLSPLNRPANPMDCAASMAIHGISKDEVMSFLERLGLIQKAYPDRLENF